MLYTHVDIAVRALRRINGRLDQGVAFPVLLHGVLSDAEVRLWHWRRLDPKTAPRRDAYGLPSKNERKKSIV